MAELTKQDVRAIMREETGPKFDGIRDQFAELREHIDDVESALNGKMDLMLTKMDGFLKGLEDEKDERLFGDAQLERRVERLEKEVPPKNG